VSTDDGPTYSGDCLAFFHLNAQFECGI